jgi:hypothetical protein
MERNAKLSYRKQNNNKRRNWIVEEKDLSRVTIKESHIYIFYIYISFRKRLYL